MQLLEHLCACSVITVFQAVQNIFPVGAATHLRYKIIQAEENNYHKETCGKGPLQDQIMTPRQLLEWAQGTIRNMNFTYVIEEENILCSRNALVKPIPGTHAFLPSSADTLIVKTFSTTNETQIHHFTVQQEKV
ncbi:hypothetical protein C0J52_20198 [Blattella germanica]|nr:hypothetical protein C0J52_20198 [Blattella germanica]